MKGRGWFDPRSEAKTDVFMLAEHLGARGFPAAADKVASLVGFVTTAHIWQKRARAHPRRPPPPTGGPLGSGGEPSPHATLPATICSAEGQLVPRLAAPFVIGTSALWCGAEGRHHLKSVAAAI